MDDAIQARLAELEARLARLEAEAAAAAGRTTTPGAAPAPAAPAAPTAPTLTLPAVPPWPEAPEHRLPSRAARRPAPAPRDYERLLGLAVLGRIGIAAMLLAAAYFGQLGWSHMEPLGRVGTIYALGAVMLGLGYWLRPSVAVLYTAMLWGGAVGACYLAGLFAYLRYQLLPEPAALLLLLASTALGQWLARILRLEALATVALAGAFAAPIWVGAATGSLTAMVILAMALHAWSAWTERTWQWHWARAVGVLGAVHLIVLHYSVHNTPVGWVDVLHLEALLLTLIGPELWNTWRLRSSSAWRWMAAASLTTITQYFLLLATSGTESCRHFGIASALLLLAVGLAYERRSIGAGTAFARLGSSLLPFGALVLATHEFTRETPAHLVRWGYAVALLAVVVLLQVLRRHAHAVDLGGSIAAVIAWSFAGVLGTINTESAWLIAMFAATPAVVLVWGRNLLTPTLALLCGAAALGHGWWPVGGFSGLQPTWAALALTGAGGFGVLGSVMAAHRRNLVLAWTAALTLATLALFWLMAALLANPTGPSGLQPFWNVRCAAVFALLTACIAARQLAHREHEAVRSVLGATAIALGYAGGLIELLDAIAAWPPGWHAVATNLYTLVYAGALLWAGFAARITALRWVGLAGFVAIVLKVAGFDLAILNTPLRMLASGALGAVLLVVAWAYARQRR